FSGGGGSIKVMLVGFSGGGGSIKVMLVGFSGGGGSIKVMLVGLSGGGGSIKVMLVGFSGGGGSIKVMLVGFSDDGLILVAAEALLKPNAGSANKATAGNTNNFFFIKKLPSICILFNYLKICNKIQCNSGGIT
ncbi:hypothetical protein COO03_10545, partial [Bacillus sp. AFS098217]